MNSSKITLIEKSVVNFLLTTASDGKSYRTKLYNLDAVIAVGYRVNSKRATWTTQILREYIGNLARLPTCNYRPGHEIPDTPVFSNATHLNSLPAENFTLFPNFVKN